MIKKYIKIALGAAIMLFSISSNAQATVLDFEQLTLDSTGYWNGSDSSGSFQDGIANFSNGYYGTYWSGFGYSNHTDTVTPGYNGWTEQNLYSSFAGSGNEGSEKFVLANISSWTPHNITFSTVEEVQGFYVTNSTYAGISMQDGDGIGKKFGEDTLSNGSDTTYTGESITNADWFSLRIFGLLDSLRTTDYVDFYLADFRFADNNQDYIVNDWRWVDLTSLGDVEGLSFDMFSSDTGQYGMNTPAYFCMDDLTIGKPVETNNMEELASLISIYPNPAKDVLNLRIPATEFNVYVMDNLGRVVLSSNNSTLDISELKNGVYNLSIYVNNTIVNDRFIKQ